MIKWEQWLPGYNDIFANDIDSGRLALVCVSAATEAMRQLAEEMHRMNEQPAEELRRMNEQPEANK